MIPVHASPASACGGCVGVISTMGVSVWALVCCGGDNTSCTILAPSFSASRKFSQFSFSKNLLRSFSDLDASSSSRLRSSSPVGGPAVLSAAECIQSWSPSRWTRICRPSGRSQASSPRVSGDVPVRPGAVSRSRDSSGPVGDGVMRSAGWPVRSVPSAGRPSGTSAWVPGWPLSAAPRGEVSRWPIGEPRARTWPEYSSRLRVSGGRLPAGPDYVPATCSARSALSAVPSMSRALLTLSMLTATLVSNAPRGARFPWSPLCHGNGLSWVQRGTNGQPSPSAHPAISDLR